MEMGVVGKFLSAVPFWVIATAGGLVICIFVIFLVIGFWQGRPVSLWPPSIGSRPVHEAGEQGEVSAAGVSQHVESRQPAEIGQRFHPDDRWRRYAVVDHDQLFGVDQLIELVVTAVNSPSANWIVSLFGDGGIGKTAAAYEATTRCGAQGRFSRIAWASATNISLGRTAGPVTASGAVYWLDLVRSIAEQTGVELGFTRTLWENELTNGVKTLGQNERILTIIDNLESIEDAEGIVSRLQELGLAHPHKVVITTRWSTQRHSLAVTEYAVKSLGRAHAVDLIRHLGRGNRDLEEVREETLDPMLAVTEGNPFLIKLVIKHYLATHRSLDLIMNELTELQGTDNTDPSLGHQVREHLYLRSLAELGERCGIGLSQRLMSSFCTKDRGSSFTSPELAAVSGITNSALFDHVLECACRLALVRSSDMNRSYSIHSLLHEFSCRRT